MLITYTHIQNDTTMKNNLQHILLLIFGIEVSPVRVIQYLQNIRQFWRARLYTVGLYIMPSAVTYFFLYICR